MNEPKKPKRKRPKLVPLKLTDEDLDRMAEITEQDIIDAAAEWKEHAENEELLESAPQVEEEGDADDS